MKKKLSILISSILVLVFIVCFGIVAVAADTNYIDDVNAYVSETGGTLYTALDFSGGVNSAASGFSPNYGAWLYTASGTAKTTVDDVDIEKAVLSCDANTNASFNVGLSQDAGISVLAGTNIVIECEFTYNAAIASNALDFFSLRFKDASGSTLLTARIASFYKSGGELKTSANGVSIVKCELGKAYNLAFSADLGANKLYCFVDGVLTAEDSLYSDEKYATVSAEGAWCERVYAGYTGKKASGEFYFDNFAVYEVGCGSDSKAIPSRYAPYCMKAEYEAYLENEALLAEKEKFDAQKNAIINAVGEDNVIFISDFTDITTPKRVYTGSGAVGYGTKTSLYYNNISDFKESLGEWHYNSVGNAEAPNTYMYLQNRGYQATNAAGGVTASPEGKPFVFELDLKWIKSEDSLTFAFYGTNDDGVSKKSYTLVTIDKDGWVTVNAQKLHKLESDKYTRLAIYVNPNENTYKTYINGELKHTRSLINEKSEDYIHNNFRFWEIRFLNTKTNKQAELYIDNLFSYYTESSVGYVGELERKGEEGAKFAPEYTYEIAAPISELPLTLEAVVKLDSGMDASVNQGYIFSGEGYGYTLSAGITSNLHPTFNWICNFEFEEITVPVGEYFNITYTVNLETKTVDCYINGTLGQSITVTSDKKYPNDKIDLSKLVIGGSYHDFNIYYFKGEIREIAFYSDIRTADEILADSAASPASDGMIAHYKPTHGAERFEELLGSGADAVKTQNEVWLDEVTKGENDYTFAVIGDTQVMTQYYPTALTKMYQWIADNYTSEKIMFAMGLGDIINTMESSGDAEAGAAADIEWERAKAAIALLNGKVPYSLVPGNHDYYNGNNRNLEKFNASFPLSYLAENNPDTFGGAYEDGKSENTYHTININGNKYMIFALEYGPRDGVLLWMENLIKNNPDHTVIITTHSYQNPDGSLVSEDDYLDPKEKFPTEGESQANNGDEMWNEIIKKYANIAMVFSGHQTQENLRVLIKEGDFGNRVTQILCDPQGMHDTGMLMLLRFSEDGRRVSVNWYSTVRNQYYRAENQFTFEVDTLVAELDDIPYFSEEEIKSAVTDGSTLELFRDFKTLLDSDNKSVTVITNSHKFAGFLPGRYNFSVNDNGYSTASCASDELEIFATKMNVTIYTDNRMNFYISKADINSVDRFIFSAEADGASSLEYVSEVRIDGVPYDMYTYNFGAADVSIIKYYGIIEKDGVRYGYSIEYGMPSYVKTVMKDETDENARRLVVNMANYAYNVLLLSQGDMTSAAVQYYSELVNDDANAEYLEVLDNSLFKSGGEIYENEIKNLKRSSEYLAAISFYFDTYEPAFAIKYSDSAKALGIASPAGRHLNLSDNPSGFYTLIKVGGADSVPGKHYAYKLDGDIEANAPSGFDDAHAWSSAENGSDYNYYFYSQNSSARANLVSASAYTVADLNDKAVFTFMNGNELVDTAEYSLAAYIAYLVSIEAPSERDISALNAAKALYSYADAADAYIAASTSK